ncbi:ParB/RepB/Spo0J family partition protein [Deinococcus humi]|uniref:ParB family chromosome partitioning protein n=1 Tax=Deinococcus humi TaxID=662880 RepID=A0A7W8JYX5_9DEIO|nr:ParB/RepB/Spo0J family partition protein [Deinococcus humi]MBB5365734.1 ParB family chromosome partitioning protein [Deinococcus humi]GGO38414.1 putative chromosome 2-partitioning protein ParB [Deinococcus humi]
MTRPKKPKPRVGLEVLLGDASALSRPGLDARNIPLTELRPSALQPRRVFTPTALAALTTSIREQGVLQPLLVRSVEGGYEIIAGERRWRAAQEAGLKEVPVVVRELDNRAALAAALIENLQREDLNVYEEVRGTVQLVALALDTDADGAKGRLYKAMNHGGPDVEVLEDLFSRLSLGPWKSFAANKLRILSWPQQVLDAMDAGLPYTLGGVVVGAPAEHQAELLELAVGGATLRELRDRLATLRERPARTALNERDVARLGRTLSSVKWIRGLNDKEQAEINKWMGKMPEAVKKALGQK